PEHERRVFRRRVHGDGLRFAQATRSRHVAEVRAVVAPVARGHLDEAAGALFRRGRVEQRLQRGHGLGEAGRAPIVEDEQRAVGWGRLPEPGEGAVADRAVEAAHARVQRGIDRITELHAEGGVADGQESRRQSARTSTPARSRAARTARAFATASGLSPWRHSVSAWSRTALPSTATTTPSRAMRTACSAAAAESVMTEPGT